MGSSASINFGGVFSKSHPTRKMNILDKIVATKNEELSQYPDRLITSESIQQLATTLDPRRGFINALKNPKIGSVGLIAEVKKASPSKGIIRPDFDPVSIAQTYEKAGASCISVLTDSQYFQGSLDYLRQIRSATSIPLLRKDFLIDPRQVDESLEAGADCILLIAAILDNHKMKFLHDLAISAGMDVLVEAHDEEEIRRAWDIGARLIGVNNRDLKTFEVDLSVTLKLSEVLRQLAEKEDPKRDFLLVGESGIYTYSDVEKLREGSAGAILVGESLMRAEDISAQIQRLMTP